jgi:hypothetical protein
LHLFSCYHFTQDVTGCFLLKPSQMYRLTILQITEDFFTRVKKALMNAENAMVMTSEDRFIIIMELLLLLNHATNATETCGNEEAIEAIRI